VQVTRGDVSVNGVRLREEDGAAVIGETGVLLAEGKKADVVVFVLP
jgi:hypothetical protein